MAPPPPTTTTTITTTTTTTNNINSSSINEEEDDGVGDGDIHNDSYRYRTQKVIQMAHFSTPFIPHTAWSK